MAPELSLLSSYGGTVRDAGEGALGRLELITQIPGHDSFATAARALYDGRDRALRQMIAKIETAAGFPLIDRSSTPLTPTDAGREFIREALQILQAAREQTTAHPDPQGGTRGGRGPVQ